LSFKSDISLPRHIKNIEIYR